MEPENVPLLFKFQLRGYKGGSNVGCVQSQECTPDRRRPARNNRSQNIPLIKLHKSPSVIDSRVEKFGNILDMIEHWEGMEKGEMEYSLLVMNGGI